MLKTTPLVVTIGLSLTIPVAVVGDVILGKENKGQAMLGAVLVLLSFVIVGLENAKQGEGEEDDHIGRPAEESERRSRTEHDISTPHDDDAEEAVPLNSGHF